MKMRKLFILLPLAMGLVLTGCSGSSEESALAGQPVDAQQKYPEVEYKKTETDLGDGIKGGEPTWDNKPVDNGLTLNLPTTTTVKLEASEKITLNASGMKPEINVEAFINYYDNGKNDARIDLDEAKTAKDGSVSMEVVLPDNISKGTYAIVVTDGTGIYNAPIVIK